MEEKEVLYTAKKLQVGKIYQSIKSGSCEFLFEEKNLFTVGNKAVMFDTNQNHFLILEKENNLFKIITPKGKIGWMELSSSRRIYRLVAANE